MREMIVTYPYRSTVGLVVFVLGSLVVLPFYVIFELFYLLYSVSNYIASKSQKKPGKSVIGKTLKRKIFLEIKHDNYYTKDRMN